MCGTFEFQCQEWLDARGTAARELEDGLQSHAERCLSCRPIYLKYKVLYRAIAAGVPAPAPPIGLVDRVLELHQFAPQTTLRPERIFVSTMRWAVAAAVLLGTGLGVRALLLARNPRNLRVDAPVAVARDVESSRALSAALADATSATLDLARVTSEPAARIGRDVISTVSLPQSNELGLPVSVAPAADVLQSVGDGVNRGVRPLSGTARRAFGFLISPALGDKPAPSRRDREA